MMLDREFSFRSSEDDLFLFKLQSDQQCFEQLVSYFSPQNSLEKSSFKFYQMFYQDYIVGNFGFLLTKTKQSKIYPLIHFHLISPSSALKIAQEIIDFIIDYVFSISDAHKVVVISLSNFLTVDRALQQYGFIIRKHSQSSVRLSLQDLKLIKKDRALYNLSKIIKQHANSLVPNLNNVAEDLLRRSSDLWYKFFARGIMLSTGGVEKSFVNLEDFSRYPLLQSFNGYMNEESHLANQETIKTFFIEENLISKENKQENLVFSFCLGSHEGIMRVLRCIYNEKYNNGLFFPMGSYGLIATSAMDLKPVGYKVALVQTDRINGEKILIRDLKNVSLKQSSFKTLFIDIKTIAGNIYATEELEEIVVYCKENHIFLIADTAHINMEFLPQFKFPNLLQIFQKYNFVNYVVAWTGSKTYGLERGRVGFILMDRQNQILSIKELESGFGQVFGTISDLPQVVAQELILSSYAARCNFLREANKKHYYNMNLMLAYLEGINSKNIDLVLLQDIQTEIPMMYWGGIPELKLIFKPKAGIQLKVDMSNLHDKYFGNIRMISSEFFCYCLNAFKGVVTLHSFQIMDPSGFSLRLSFSIKEDVHKGMQKIFQFVKSLSPDPQENKFLSEKDVVDDLVFPPEDSQKLSIKTQLISNAKNNLFFYQVRQVQNQMKAETITGKLQAKL
jgi:hypothetical protein